MNARKKEIAASALTGMRIEDRRTSRPYTWPNALHEEIERRANAKGTSKSRMAETLIRQGMTDVTGHS